MARKYIIQDGQFIMGNVGYHFELKLKHAKSSPEGGGYWHVDPGAKILYLFSSSTEFGGMAQDRLKEVVSTAFMDPNLEGYKVLHSHAAKFIDVEEDEWEELHTIDLIKVAQIEESRSVGRGNMLSRGLTAGGRAMMNEMSPRNTVEVRTEPKIQRNAPCPCGSGKKYKKCCI